jgi:hypothetical protein
MLKPALSSPKIIAILKYLEKSKMIEVDLDGNIIWLRQHRSAGGTIFDSAVMNEDFRKLIQSYDEKDYSAD